jgi:alcohol dehydrogenase (NADP+)
VLGWELSDHDMAALSSFTINTRMVDGSFFVSPHGPYNSLHDLWDE